MFLLLYCSQIAHNTFLTHNTFEFKVANKVAKAKALYCNLDKGISLGITPKRTISREGSTIDFKP